MNTHAKEAPHDAAPDVSAPDTAAPDVAMHGGAAPIGTFVINVDESGETSNDAPECRRSDNPSTKTSDGRAGHGTTIGKGAEMRCSEVVSGDQDRTNRPENTAAEASFTQPRAIPQEAAATYGPDPIARFVDTYGLSRRERDVFELSF